MLGQRRPRQSRLDHRPARSGRSECKGSTRDGTRQGRLRCERGPILRQLHAPLAGRDDEGEEHHQPPSVARESSRHGQRGCRARASNGAERGPLRACAESHDETGACAHRNAAKRARCHAMRLGQHRMGEAARPWPVLSVCGAPEEHGAPHRLPTRSSCGERVRRCVKSLPTKMT